MAQAENLKQERGVNAPFFNMVSRFFLEELMLDAMMKMDDKSLPSEIRRASRARFGHIQKRLSALGSADLMSGMCYDEEDDYSRGRAVLKGYSEI